MFAARREATCEDDIRFPDANTTQTPMYVKKKKSMHQTKDNKKDITQRLEKHRHKPKSNHYRPG
ncbi:hypothetical protein BOTNAR_0086g00180 [Botryotinia narcissicola]|uniref:Uncharacterized protein n=1 Tax=Botryotinia narcissicola TaxID=278944 RepID=A0A4Z1ISY1_9HELO|nr:hypothetical protein BOTNAR_0086g00180 [Botryotinia narcissicola]